ncbi:MAG: hypothetical protein E6H53_05940 [Betaproteobacteria bacterium]|nr:MAG: hypothetical protein E6H53_05940 [Betaproteobacteria bacterium]
MNRELHRLAARKQVLLAELQLQRMQITLYASDARDALRPAGLIGGAVARPAAAMALVDTIARLLGWHRVARIVRLGAIALTAFRIANLWRVRQRGPSSPS